ATFFGATAAAALVGGTVHGFFPRCRRPRVPSPLADDAARDRDDGAGRLGRRRAPAAPRGSETMARPCGPRRIRRLRRARAVGHAGVPGRRLRLPAAALFLLLVFAFTFAR